MSSPDKPRDALVAAILRATAEMSTGRAALTQVVAERFGLAATDVECLGLLAAEGSMPVGRLGELIALTTGATTRMVDRLEQAGHVRRLADPADRRRVIVELVPERVAAIRAAFEPLEAAGRDALAALPDDGLGAIHAYLGASVTAARDATARLRTAGPGPEEAGSVAPVASATRGRLVFVTAAPNVAISADPALGPELYRARFGGSVPSARVRDGLITIRFPRFAWFDFRGRIADQWLDASAHWRRDLTELVLNDGLPWTIEFRGGATAVRADLHGLRLEDFEVAGGASQVAVTLGRPAGVVRVRVRGGVGNVSVLRPAGVAVRLSVAGGYRSAVLDGVAAWSGGRIATPGAEASADRFEVEVSGGANNVSVGIG